MKQESPFRISPTFLLLFLTLWGCLLLLCFMGSMSYLKNSFSYILDFLVFILVSAVVYATGFIIYRMLKLDCPTKMEESIYCCVFGIGVMSYLVLGVGLLGFLYKEVFYLIFIIIAIFLVPYIYKNWSVCQEREEEIAGKRVDKYWELVLCSILFFLFIFSLINALAPVTEYDAMVYHYGLPNIFIQEHKICYLPENVYSAFPLNIEMLFTLGTLLKGYEVSNLMQYGISVLFLLSIYAFVRRYFDYFTALLATALLLTTPLVAHAFSRPAADMGLALFICLSLFSLIIWFDVKKDRWLISSALCCGFSLGTKYTALFFALGLLGFMLLGKLLIEKSTLKRIFTKLSIFLLISIVIASPWYLKNWITTGNPFFPAFYEIFGGEDFSNAIYSSWLRDARHPGFSLSSIMNFLLLPYRLLSSPHLFGLPTGPFFIFFWPFLLVLRKRNAIINYLIIFTFGYFILWAFSFQVTRFMIPALSISAILGAFVFEELRRARERYLSYSTVCFIIVVMVCNVSIFLSQSRVALDPFPIVFGVVSKSDYLKKYLSVFQPNSFDNFKASYNNQDSTNEYGDVFSIIEYANQNLEPTDKILFLGETMHAYLRRKYICSTGYNRNILVSMLQNNISDGEILKRLCSLRITHILFNVDELKRFSLQGYSFKLDGNDIKRLQGFLFKTTFVEFKKGNVLLLKINNNSKLSGRH